MFLILVMTEQHFSTLFEISKDLFASGKFVFSSMVQLKPFTSWGDINSEQPVWYDR